MRPGCRVVCVASVVVRVGATAVWSGWDVVQGFGGKWSSVMASPKVTAACQYPGRRMARSRRKKKQEDSMAGSSWGEQQIPTFTKSVGKSINGQLFHSNRAQKAT